VIIGAGVIGLEMGSVYKRLGTEVLIIEYADQICPFLDGDVAKSFTKSLKNQGIEILTGHKVVSGSNNGTSGSVIVEPVKGGEAKTFEADHILVCTGRKPFVEGLNAREIGIEFDKNNRIVTNDHLQTNLPNVYAIGDVIVGPMLAHKSEEEGVAAIEFIAGKGGHVNYNAIPSVIYTHPEVAWVGKNEEELKKAGKFKNKILLVLTIFLIISSISFTYFPFIFIQGVKYTKGSFPMMANSRAKANDDFEGLVKVLTEKDTDKILGVHIISSAAGELIGEATLALEYGASAEDIGRTCHAHPTLSEALKEACMGAYDKPINM
jgi:dihydrolipoamide dehydrogenase